YSSIRFGEERQKTWSPYLCSCRTQGAQTLLKLRDAFLSLSLSLLCQRPATQERTDRHPEWESLVLRKADSGFSAFLGSTPLTTQAMIFASTDEGRTEAVRVYQVLRQGHRLVDPRQPLLRIAQTPQCPSTMDATQDASVFAMEECKGAVLLDIVECYTL